MSSITNTKVKLGTFPITQQVTGIGHALLNTIGLIKDIGKVIFKTHYDRVIKDETDFAFSLAQEQKIISENSPDFKRHLQGILWGAITATPVLGTALNALIWHARNVLAQEVAREREYD